MTTITLNYSQNLLNSFASVLKKTLQGIMIGYILARQTQANARLARIMIHEYRREGHTVDSLTHELNAKTLKSVWAEFKND